MENATWTARIKPCDGCRNNGPGFHLEVAMKKYDGTTGHWAVSAPHYATQAEAEADFPIYFGPEKFCA